MLSRRALDLLVAGSSRIHAPIVANSARMLEPISANSARVNGPAKMRSGLICTLSEAKYLKVEPQTIWLLPENNFNAEIVVYSNVTWRIE